VTRAPRLRAVALAGALALLTCVGIAAARQPSPHNGGRPPGFAAQARERAHAILSEKRFKPAPGLPHPLRRFLRWLGGILHSVTGAVGRAIDSATGWLPGGSLTFWTAVALAVIGLGALAATRLGRRLAGRQLERSATRSRLDRLDPRRLEQEAAEAERRGEYERALRLLFRAGLLRLDRAEAIDFRESLTTGDVARRLRLPAFDSLGARFDEVAYGGEPALSGDLQTSREKWRAVLREARAA
jgi:Domain of unknown function (DUF4129)